MKTLPKKPSKLIRLALKDLETVEKLPRYVVNMARWHVGYAGGTCSVCFAGAVMSQTLKVPPTTYKIPCEFGAANYRRLLALNDFRIGDLHDGLYELGYGRETAYFHDIPETITVPTYAENPHAFKKAMREMASAFQRLDL